ncbi:hypothetical protein ES708_21241 [subsurface metagenome]
MPTISLHPFHYDFTLGLYLVASLGVYWTKSYRDYSEDCVVIEPVKKDVEKFKLPLDFLEAISLGNLSQFEQGERDNQGYYTWHIPSINQDIKLHGVLLKSLEDALKGKPLGPALIYYGLANWEEGKLAEQSLSLMPPPTTTPALTTPLCRREEVEEALTGKTLGKSKADTGAALDAVFNPSLSLEGNIKSCLKYFSPFT